MATVVISEAAAAFAERLVAEGRFESVQQALETGLYGLDDDDEIDPDAEADAIEDISDEDREAIREGLRDIKEGRVLTADEVFGPLLAKYEAMAANR